MIQLDLTGQGLMIATLGCKAPFVLRVDLNLGVTGQHPAFLIHPLQCTGRRAQRAAIQRQTRIRQRLTVCGNLRILGLTGSCSLRDRDFKEFTGNLIVIVIFCLGSFYKNGADLKRGQDTVFIDGRFAGAAFIKKVT